jgi:hypothetical protein
VTRHLLALTVLLGLAGQAEAGELDDTARFLAGLPLPAEAQLAAKFGDHRRYQRHRRRIEWAWAGFERGTLRPLATWARAELPQDTPFVFYPFSGPDIVHALRFFPSCPSFVLVGLEALGAIPDPEKAPRPDVLRGLDDMDLPIRQLLGLKFFRTADMKTQLRAHRYAGMAGLLMFFLARMNQEILDARFVTLTEAGEVVAAASPVQATGIQIVFRARDAANPDSKADSKADAGAADERTVTYWKANLSDKTWAENQALLRFLDRQGPPVTLLKAASYLMFKRQFTHIKEEIVGRSRAIVQEASGVPFRDLTNGRWNLRLYGRYAGVIPLFRIRNQPALRRALAEESRGPLPFPFGYDRIRRRSHLIFAESTAVSTTRSE